MKTAKTIVLVAVVLCPVCDANIMPMRGNSFDWTPDTIDDAVKTVVCDDCGTRSKVPTIKFS